MKQRIHLPNTIDLAWRTPWEEYYFFLEWNHGPLYSDQCAVCQQGVQLIMKAVAWMHEGLLIDRRSIVNQDSRGIVVEVRPEVYRTIPTDDQKIIVVDDLDGDDIHAVVEWFIKKFEAQFQMAHVHTVFLTDDEEILFEKTLDF